MLPPESRSGSWVPTGSPAQQDPESEQDGEREQDDDHRLGDSDSEHLVRLAAQGAARRSLW